VIGILYAGQFGSVSPTSLEGIELTALAAAILGGTSLFGGAGSVVNSVAGALLLIVLSNGFAVLNLGANWQLLIQGAVIIAAAAFFVIAERRGGRVRGQKSSISPSATAADSEPGLGERSGG
jgi:D-xylose transport system permease protein